MKKLASLIAISLAMFVSTSVLAHAYFYNLGSLEIKPLTDKTNQEWFIEYLVPGQTIERKIQISNSSDSEKRIQLYGSDSLESEETAFLTQTNEEVKKDEANIAQWMSLPDQELRLKPQESKIIAFSFDIPDKAGIGLHKGAIIAREITINANGNEIHFEKGIRIYLNVIGPSISSSYQQKERLEESHQQFSYQVTTVNNGTTDLKIDHVLALEKIWGETIPESSQSKKLKPEESFTTQLSLQKPTIGVYNLILLKNGEKQFIKTVVVMPFWLEISAIVCLAFIIKKSRNIKKWLTRRSSSTLPAYRKSFAYWGIFGIMTVSFFSFQNHQAATVNAQLPEERAVNEYYVTMRWGNVRSFNLPNQLTREWNGKLTLTGGAINIQELLNFEKNDMAEIVDNGRSIEWKTTTGPDNDGIILKMSSLSDTVMTYKNILNDTELRIALDDIVNQPLIIPHGLFSLEIKSEPILQEVAIMEEREASAEVQEEKRERPVPELQNLFVEEIPATAEVLENFILESNYVKNVKTEEVTAKVEADSILIKTLEETPEILERMRENADVNYIFVPTETVSFPPQEFSFDKTSYSTQELGSIIFVQNKETPWNAYVSTTNFDSLSGKGRIPASALTIIPGEPKILTEENRANIQMGTNKNFRNTSDKSVLVNVNPNGDSDEIFVLNPRLEIHIPAGTLPGKYRGSLTITTL